MDLAKQKTASGNLNEFSMVLLNNLLSIPLGFILICIFERDVLSMSALKISMFWVVATRSGVLGLAISFTSMWFLHQTSPTTHRTFYWSYVICKGEDVRINFRT